MYIALATTNCTALAAAAPKGVVDQIYGFAHFLPQVQCTVPGGGGGGGRGGDGAQVILQVPYSSSSMCLLWTHKGPTGERVLLLLWS